jgi:hypothetical protein
MTILLIATLLLPAKGTQTPLCSIIFLATTLDIVRWYYKHVCYLLDPNIAITKLEFSIKKLIDKYEYAAHRFVRMSEKVMPYENKNALGTNDLEKAFYLQPSVFLNEIYNHTDQISEFSLKALSRNDNVLVHASLHSLVEVTIYYLNKRKDNLHITRSPDLLFLVQESDADRLLNHVFDLIKRIGLAAVAKDDESVCGAVFKEYCAISACMASLNENTYFMVSTPIAYMKTVVYSCIQKRLFDSPYDAGLKLCRLAYNLPSNAPFENTYQPIIELVKDISIYYVVLKKSAITNKLCGATINVLLHLQANNYWQIKEVIKVVLELFETVVFSVLHVGEDPAQGLVLQTAITSAYTSLSQDLVLKFAEKANENNDAHMLMEISSALRNHFSDLAKHCEFESNRMLQDLLSCLTDMFKIFIWYIHAQEDEDKRVVILENIINPYLCLLPVFFYGKKKIDSHYNQQAVNILAYVAISCVSLEWNRHDIFTLSSKLVRNMLNTYVADQSIGNGYTVIYILERLWRLKLIAEKYDLSAAAKIIDDLITQKPGNISDAEWQSCQDNLENKKRNLLKYIEEDDHRYESSIDISLNALMSALRSRLK